jgi:RND family efflux transporter MFP subunit
VTAPRCSAGLLLAGALAGLMACRAGGNDGPAPTPSPAPTPAGTPVRTARVGLADLAETISAPGHTEALTRQQVRAPFNGTLTELSVVVGDSVQRGQRVGAIVARDAQAAVDGAETMLRNASTPVERADAERALKLARAHLVLTPLTSSVSGVVTSCDASAGDRVAEDQSLLTVAARDSFVFVADLPQSNLDRVRPGQEAKVVLSGASSPLHGTVHGVLATANSSALTAPLRIDLAVPQGSDVIGLFGTVSITVARKRHVPVVPAAAVLTDDVSGAKRVAEVVAGKAHWVAVETGLSQDGQVEITNPTLDPGTEVIIRGQVGLPEGTSVVSEQ